MKALFLDRDGVINIDHGYVSQIAEFEFTEGIFEFCQRAKASDFKIIVVTNQSGIGRGYYQEQDFWTLTNWMCEQFKAKGVEVSQVYFCPHHPEKAIGQYLQICQCRKPEPGMLLQAQQEFNIDMSQSVMVGDKHSDMQVADRAGVKWRLKISAEPDELAHCHGKQLADLQAYCLQQQIFKN
ncbi:D-glycero-beta-D-manno-heptose 1,7-bisphosphate 7-phosphatase [Catenovulum sp. SM1970]|uniref:D-glycero-beta-D-manno-heptose 1,7-bisphosphate 7-phosphatase n=1 Tax=Marinifaba aquimaris TaxID=2741323 RepID=UPI001572FCE8|nr:D-glycero-beta-D-manno-heptose 1,7-bisphosphate 7-phosphatase [Marinifaba aquimaris]NTS75715.1 D-glycero-beta-D-manno-heptose 1,7-bisphosphate 7-phosphatase [Marinifaba aquimaris]